MQIDRMTIEDLPEVAVLAEQLGYPNKKDELEKRFREIIQSRDYALFVARTDSGRVIG